MKSVVYELEGPGQLAKRVESLRVDTLGEEQIFAETKYSVISPGTECAAWLGLPPLRPSKQYPRLMGYCNLAQVEKVGSSIRSLAPGDIILTHQSHRSAFICSASEVLLQIRKEFNGDDAFQKRIAATYLFHLGYSALLAAGYQPGHQVAIVGMGTLGIASALLAQGVGCQPFVFTAQESSKQRLSSFGLTKVFAKQFPEAEFRDQLFGMDGVDIAINTSNRWSDYALSLQLARKGGTVVCLGFPGRGEPSPDFNPLESRYFYDKQLSIKHCGQGGDLEASAFDVRFNLKRNMAYLESLIVSGRIEPLHILSKEVGWEELGSLYHALSEREPGLYSAVLKWKN